MTYNEQFLLRCDYISHGFKATEAKICDKKFSVFSMGKALTPVPTLRMPLALAGYGPGDERGPFQIFAHGPTPTLVRH